MDIVRRPAPTDIRVAYQQWSGNDLASGTSAGVELRAGVLHMTRPLGTTSYVDPFVSHAAAQEFDYAHWVSPEVHSIFGFTDLIASWQVTTPEGTWVELATRVTGTTGDSPWMTLARWSSDDSTIRPMSVPGQRATTGRVSTDAWLAEDDNRGLSWRLRITLFRPAGGTTTPTVRRLGALVSTLPSQWKTSQPGPTVGRVLDVPRYSQRVHAGQYPHWDGGGDSWCSPASTSMVMRYWGQGPAPAEYAWVEPDYTDRHIHHAVRHCFDYAYAGAGNWSFNTAYAASYDLDAFVTRLRDLTEAELFIDAGIPLVASIQVGAGELDGAEYTARGHLLVIAGFTPQGDVICHDPAALDNAGVRRVYRRDQLERAWLTASGGIVYVIHPPSVPLPRPPAEANW